MGGNIHYYIEFVLSPNLGYYACMGAGIIKVIWAIDQLDGGIVKSMRRLQ